MSIIKICKIFGFSGTTLGDSQHGVTQNRKARRKAKKNK